jgi:hypothetical protein
MYLSEQEIAFFAENGYLIKRAVLDPDLMAQARDRLWADAPPELKRDDPATWVGAFAQTRGTWKHREPGGEPWMVDLLARNPTIRGVAEQLLGQGTLQEAERVRGIYCIFPEGDTPEHPMRLHVDRHPFHLSVVGYIDDVPPGGGGFTVWPGSHRRFYHTFKTRYTFQPTDAYVPERDAMNQLPPADCHGQAGDVVFWHHRLGHSGGHNRSKQIRQAVLYDFLKTDLETTQDLPSRDDMWRDWPGVIAVSR